MLSGLLLYNDVVYISVLSCYFVYIVASKLAFLDVA